MSTKKLRFRKVYQNLIASDQNTYDGNEEMKAHRPATAMSDHEFDIHQNYHNAIDCILHCESNTKTLQEQLARKDARIAILEKKLVQMSLELASAKALEDEHQLFRRRMTGSTRSISSSSSTEYSHPPQLIVDCAPNKDSPKNSSSLAAPRSHPSFSQSWLAPRNSSDEVTPIHHAPSARSLSRVGPKCRPSLGYSLTVPPSNSEVAAPIIHNVPSVPQAMNTVAAAAWGLGLSQLKRGSWAPGNDDSPLDTSLDDSSKENMSTGGTRFRATSRCDSSPATLAYNMNGTRRTALDENHPTRRGSEQIRSLNRSTASSNASWRSFLDDESNTSRQPSTPKQLRRLPSMGQLLGLSKNINAEKTNATATVIEETHQTNFGESNFGESVVFPVTSGDCLVGLGGAFGNSTSGRGSSNANANEEWPTFR